MSARFAIWDVPYVKIQENAVWFFKDVFQLWEWI